MQSILQNYIIKLTQELISIPSYESQTKSLHDIFEVFLENIPKDFQIEYFEDEGIKSALIYNTPIRPDRFTVLFNCHLDIIPWKDIQYIPRIESDRIIGAWANDMKWNLVAALFAFLECAKLVQYPLAFQIVTDEEVGWFHGTKHQVDQWVRADFIIATEPTNMNIVTKAKWVIWLKISCTWKTAHGAYPWRWENAIEKMIDYIRILQDIIQNPIHDTWETTLNISNIQTDNLAINKIPDSCSILIDIRYIPEDRDVILKKIQDSLPENFTIEIIENEASVFVEEDNIYVGKLLDSIQKITWKKSITYWANGTSDGRHFSDFWWKSIEFWAVGWWIGEDIEWVSIASLESYSLILSDFLMTLDSSNLNNS